MEPIADQIGTVNFVTQFLKVSSIFKLNTTDCYGNGIKQLPNQRSTSCDFSDLNGY